MNNERIEMLLQQVAKAHGQSVAEVRAEIEKAILSAYIFPNKEALSVPRKGEIPTIEEIIEYVSNKIEKNNL